MTTTEERADPEAKAPQQGFFAGIPLVRSFVAESRGRIVASAALAVVVVVLQLVPYYLVYQAVRQLLDGTITGGTVALYAGVAALAVIGQFTVLGFSSALSHRAAFDILFRLRLAMAARLARLPLGALGGSRSGEIKKVLLDETERLEHVIGHAIPETVSSAAVWLGVTVWLFVVDWRMALASIAIVPIAFACMGRAVAKGAKRIDAYQAAGSRMNGSIVEYLVGMPVVKVFNRSGEAFAETRDAVDDHTRLETAWARDYIPFGGAFYSLILSSIVVILPVGVILFQLGEIDLVTLLFFVILGGHYAQPLVRLFGTAARFAQISSGAALVESVLTAPELPDTGRRVALQGHDVTFESVDFGYAGRPVLHDVSFTAETGKVTALVGPSGAGKTTIAKLAARFTDVDAGRVLVGGHDVREIAVEQLMETVSFVFQETFLFRDSVAANIRMGRPDASDADVVAAATAARCDEFVRALPEGYETVIGERGGTLSGGEKQRLALARAILADGPVVVLDEATAFADPENEALIQEAISALARGKTLIVVAHRLGTIMDADRILVVADGRIAESGTHQELLDAGGRYAALWADHVAADTIELHGGERCPR